MDEGLGHLSVEEARRRSVVRAGAARARPVLLRHREDACVHAAPLRRSTEASRVCVCVCVCVFDNFLCFFCVLPADFGVCVETVEICKIRDRYPGDNSLLALHITVS